MKIKNLIAIGLLANCAFACYGVAAAEVVVDDSDKAEAPKAFAYGKKHDIKMIGARHLDGVKGLDLHIEDEPPIRANVLPDPVLDGLRSLACGAQAFGLVELEDAISFVGSGDLGVFTKLRFKLVDDWRAKKEANGKVVHLVVPGGEVNNSGERIRISTKYANFKTGEQYILYTGTRFNPKKVIYDTPPLIEVQDKTLFVAADSHSPLSSGLSPSQAKALVNKALSQKGCER